MRQLANSTGSTKEKFWQEWEKSLGDVPAEPLEVPPPPELVPGVSAGPDVLVKLIVVDMATDVAVLDTISAGPDVLVKLVVVDMATDVAVLDTIGGEDPPTTLLSFLLLLAPTMPPTTAAMMIPMATTTRMMIPLGVRQNGRFATGIDTPSNSAGAMFSLKIFSGIAGAIVGGEGE